MEVRTLKGADDITLIADVGGDSGDPAVVLLHGAGETRHTLARMARVLVSAGRYVISLDLRGHGQSDWVDGSRYRLDDYIADVISVIDQMKIRPAVIGTRLGGLIALGVAGRLSASGRDDIGAVAVINAAPRASEDKRRRIMDFMTAPDGFESLEEAVAAVTARRPQLAAMPLLRRNLRQHADGRWHWRHDPRVFEQDAPWREESLTELEHLAEKIEAPALLLRTANNEVMQPKYALHLRSLLSKCDYVDLDEDAALDINGDFEDLLDAELLRFLEREMRRPDERPVRSGIDPLVMRHALGCFGTGVTIITTRGPDGEPIGITANSFCSVSLDPPLVLFCVDKRANRLPAFEASATYAINVLHIGQQDLSNRFVRKDQSNWADVGWETWETGAPIIQESMASFECDKQDVVDAGDHRIFIGRVRRVWFDPSRDPLMFFQGKYRRVHLPG